MPARDQVKLTIEHLGMSGLRLQLGSEALCVDPPEPGPEPAILTWTEAERLSGARGRPLVAPPEVLAWLGVAGTALLPGRPARVAGAAVRALAYAPIPYAVPAEAVRKTRIALTRPRFVLRRLAHTLSVPSLAPLALRLEWSGWVLVLCQQALHRFVDPAEAARLRQFGSGASVALASPDFEDERACGRLLASLGAQQAVLVDAIGPVRRRIGLPTRPLAASLPTAGPGTLLLEARQTLVLELPALSPRPAPPADPTADPRA